MQFCITSDKRRVTCKISQKLFLFVFYTGSLDAERLLRELNITMEQAVAVRNFLRNHIVKTKDEIITSMPASLRITPQVINFTIALIHNKFI